MTRRIESFKEFSASCIVVVENGRGMVKDVTSKTRHQGHAKALLTAVIKYADQNDLELFLTAQAYGHPVHTILDNHALVSFYESFGFEKVIDYISNSKTPMVRPRRKNNAYSERENRKDLIVANSLRLSFFS